MARMGRGHKREKIKEQQVQGVKHFKTLLPMLAQLHNVATERDRAHNRKLHFDQYASLFLLAMFNPIITSLRALQQATELKKVQRKLGCARASLGSLSEAARVFDADLLEPIIGQLAQRLNPIAEDGRLQGFDHVITLVDGTLIEALPRVTEAMWLTGNGQAKHSWRLHTQFALLTGTPKRIDITNGSGSGDGDERAVLATHVEPDHCYVMDRGYARFTLFNRIAEVGSSYVCRVRDNSVYDVVEQHELTDVAREADVLEDVTVQMGTRSKAAAQPDHAIRLIKVRITPNVKRKDAGVRGGHGSDGVLRIATNLHDVPAEIIALLYQRRWAIEVFFRFFKHVLGCRTLLSECANGIRVQTYCAIIACLLIALYTGRRPTLRTYEMVCWYFSGMADEQELLNHLAKLQKQA